MQKKQSYFSIIDVLVLAIISALLHPFQLSLSLSTENTVFFQYLTGHLVHINWIHWLLNLTALACLPLLITKFPRLLFWCLIPLLSVSISILLLTFHQLQNIQVTHYFGLSGVLHGIFIFVALHDGYSGWQQKRRSWQDKQAVILLFGIMFKLVYEHLMQPTQTADLIKAPVVYMAHVDGFLMAVFLFILYFGLNQVKPMGK